MIEQNTSLEAETGPVYLFVYGTLRRASDPHGHALLLPATLVESGSVPGQMYDLGNYPGAVFLDGTDACTHGEIYLLHDPVPTLARLDAYEGCSGADPQPHEYSRVRLQVRLDTGAVLTCWGYRYDRVVGHLTLVPAGDWLLWRRKISSSSDGH